MLCLKTCALRWTMREPVLWVEYCTSGSKIRVMVLILPAAQPSTWRILLAQVPFGLEAYPPVPDDGDYHYSQDHETRGHQEQGDVLGRLAPQVRVEECLGEDAEGRGRYKAPEPHPGEPRSKGDGVESD